MGDEKVVSNLGRKLRGCRAKNQHLVEVLEEVRGALEDNTPNYAMSVIDEALREVK